MDNIFFNTDSQNEKQEIQAAHSKALWDSVFSSEEGRKNLGNEMPVAVYRMFEYAMRDTLVETFGEEKMIEVFRAAGEKTGIEFCNRCLDISQPINDFMAQLQKTLMDLKIGVLRIEQFDADTGHAVLTVSEDLDCSGLPKIGETVCNYDEGFIAGILKTYTKKDYIVIEIDCWATGARECRFDASIISNESN